MTDSVSEDAILQFQMVFDALVRYERHDDLDAVDAVADTSIAHRVATTERQAEQGAEIVQELSDRLAFFGLCIDDRNDPDQEADDAE